MDDKMTYNLLMRYGADPNLQDSFGNMILHVVVARERLVYLIDHDASLHFPTKIIIIIPLTMTMLHRLPFKRTITFQFCIKLQILSPFMILSLNPFFKSEKSLRILTSVMMIHF